MRPVESSLPHEREGARERDTERHRERETEREREEASLLPQEA